VTRYQTERDDQFENYKLSEKDLVSSLKATSVYFMSAVLNKIKNNEWIIELTNQYPTVFIENGERITV
jgi:Tat protein secretion system quality control protein TatD with DNase activity